MDRHIKAPLDREEVKTLEAGDYVYITEEKNFQLN